MADPRILSAEYLARIKTVTDAATPPPWSTLRTDPCCVIPYESHHDLYQGLPGQTGDNVACHTASDEDAVFMAAARSAVPALIAYVDALTEELAETHASIAAWRGGGRIIADERNALAEQFDTLTKQYRAFVSDVALSRVNVLDRKNHAEGCKIGFVSMGVAGYMLDPRCTCGLVERQVEVDERIKKVLEEHK